MSVFSFIIINLLFQEILRAHIVHVTHTHQYQNSGPAVFQSIICPLALDRDFHYGVETTFYSTAKAVNPGEDINEND